jgi:glycosyltransferase involved in cell wall biosynthesis
MTRAAVLLPTLDRRELVVRAVKSVIAQTRQDFELLIVDGGSTDGTREALEPLIDERIRFVTIPGIGVSAARNAALRRTSAPFVAFLDSDDRWLPEHLEVVGSLLDRHPQAVLASTSPHFETAGRAAVDKAIVVDPFPRIFVGIEAGWTTGIAVRRAAIEAAGGFDERLLVGEDEDLWRRLALQGRFVYLRRRTVTVRRTVGSLSDRGRQRGLHFEAFERSAARLAEEADRAGRRDLGDPALGSVHWARALRAGAAADEAMTREELSAATRLLPALSREADLVIGTIRWYFSRLADAPDRPRAFLTLAGAWPDQGTKTVVWLRGAAVLAALRAGQARLALKALRGVDRGPALRLAVGIPRGLPYHLRRALGGLVHRGRESADVGASLDIVKDERAGGHRG